MAKTLILNLGQAGNPRPASPAFAQVEIDGIAPKDLRSVRVLVDAGNPGEPAHFCLERIRIIDGLEFAAEEAHHILNMSLIIEYEEAQ